MTALPDLMFVTRRGASRAGCGGGGGTAPRHLGFCGAVVYILNNSLVFCCACRLSGHLTTSTISQIEIALPSPIARP